MAEVDTFSVCVIGERFFLLEYVDASLRASVTDDFGREPYWPRSIASCRLCTYAEWLALKQ